MREKGFTLVELVVVVTIIMVITVIGMVSFSGINKKSRDSRRISDLEKLAIALEVYKQENGVYPANLDLLESGYIDAVPTDPKTYAYYYSKDDDDDYNYYLYAHVEDVGSTTGSYGENNCPSGTSCNYRISSP